MTVSALIFDVDGTLAETEEVHRWAFNETFRAGGLPWNWDQPLYAELLRVTGGKERIRHYMQTIQSPLLAQDGLDEFIADLHREKTAYYTKRVDQGGVELRPGVARLIKEARAGGVRLAIATTTSHPNVVSLLRSTLGPESLEWFEVLGTGESAPRKKPDPGVYTWVLEQLGLQPEQCLALEDSTNGLRAALAAGVPTVITVSFYSSGEDFSGAVAVMDHLGEPTMPFRLVQAKAVEKGYADLELLEAWHQQVEVV